MVTTVAVMIVTLLGCIVAFYLIGILRDIREIAKTARREVDGFADDFDRIREDVRESVAQVREGVEEGVHVAKTYSRAAGARGVNGVLSFLVDTIVRSRTSRNGRKGRVYTRKATKKE